MSQEQEQFFAQAETRPEPKRNQWGQYVLPDPETGEEKGYVRATTWCKTLADTFALEKWALRQTLVGVAKREDLLALVQSIRDPDHEDAKKQLNRIAEQAKEAAGSSMRSNLGTAGHAFAERLDMGELAIADAPLMYRKDLQAYEDAKAAHGITIQPHLMEKVVLIPELGVAGTFDRLVKWDQRPGVNVVLDLKTGRTMMHSWAEVIIQQALYSRAKWMAVLEPDGSTKVLEPMPDVCQDTALIVHLPVGEALCYVYELPYLEDAWEMAQLAGKVRAWRKRKDLAKLLESSDPFADAIDATATEVTDSSAGGGAPADQGVVTPGEPGLVTQAPGLVTQAGEALGDGDGDAPPAQRPPMTKAQAQMDEPEPQDRTAWVKERLAIVKAAGEEARLTMVANWPHDVPARGPWTPEQVERLLAALAVVEAAHCLPFPAHSDPEAPTGPPAKWAKDKPLPDAPKNGRKVSADRVAQLKAAALELSPEAVAVVKQWMREGAEAGRSWEPVGVDYHDRVWHVTMAALQCARCFPEDTEALTRACLALQWGAVDKPPSWSSRWPTGAVLGCLSADQATEVRRMAQEFDEGALAATAALGETAVLEP